MLVVAAVAIAAALPLAGTAGAKQGRLLATPSAVCSTLVEWGAGGYTSFGNGMGRINKDVAAYRFPDDETGELISLSERCTQFEEGVYDPVAMEFFQISYPFFFKEPPGWPFPEFTAQNHVQCETTLFAYHTHVTIFGP
jgi:hypothetical protein